MDVAREAIAGGAVEGTAIFAGNQTAARGRLKRTWFSPAGNISVSVILYPAMDKLPYLTMLAAVGVMRSVNTVTGLAARIKWPNDVWINGKKVCGILIENSLRGAKVDYAVLGIGLNINLDPADYPEIEPTATSLSQELGSTISRRLVAQQMLRELDRLYRELRQGQTPYDEWRRSLLTLGQAVTVRRGETFYEGTAESVAPDGSLMLRLNDGTLVKIVAEDVTLRR
jgi:BirA family biotin operon repressor/biotin-[acetyl-CoA-carboxylase] ligase